MQFALTCAMENNSESEKLLIRVGVETGPTQVTFSSQRNSQSSVVADKNLSGPLIETDTRDKLRAPIVGSEIDELDDDDDREVAATPYPGVDDGFFGNGEPPRDPDAEDFIPEIDDRAGR